MNPPPAVPDRPVVRVVHPSGHLEAHTTALERGLARLETAGCEVRWEAGRAKASWRGYLAGDDEARAVELCAALEEPGVDIIWCARGGSGMNRIIPRVLAHAATLPPRAVVGFSDITALLNALATNLDWITFHGPVVSTFGRNDPSASPEDCLAALRGDQSRIHFQPGGGQPVVGRLLGGNLTVLSSMVGTGLPTQASTDAIWLLEDVGEAPYRLDRAFCQWRQAGYLNNSVALWFGDLDLDDETTDQVISNLTSDAGLPALRNAPAGHRGDMAMLPIGAKVRIDPIAGTLEAMSPWVTIHGD